jgi:peptidoglycan hydrolase CwlO-like protein
LDLKLDSVVTEPDYKMDKMELLKAMKEIMEDQIAKQEQMKKELMAEMKAGQARMQAEMDAWLAEMKDWRRESEACQETTEACRNSKELSPEEIESELERREVPT